MSSATIQIFRSGTHTDMGGRSITIKDFDLEMCSSAYNAFCDERPAPLVLGHPANDAPQYGFVRRLIAAAGALFAEVDPSVTLRALVRAGRYRKVSAAFFMPRSSENPSPGTYFLKHVGFLGAQPPSVKGMADPVFSESLCFASGHAAADVECLDTPVASPIELDGYPVSQRVRERHRRIEALCLATGGRISFTEAAMALGY